MPKDRVHVEHKHLNLGRLICARLQISSSCARVLEPSLESSSPRSSASLERLARAPRSSPSLERLARAPRSSSSGAFQRLPILHPSALLLSSLCPPSALLPLPSLCPRPPSLCPPTSPLILHPPSLCPPKSLRSSTRGARTITRRALTENRDSWGGKGGPPSTSRLDKTDRMGRGGPRPFKGYPTSSGSDIFPLPVV